MTKTETNAEGDAGGGRDGATAAPVEWHLARDGKQYGPVTPVEIAKLVELGHLKDGDLVWRAGFAEWRPLGQVRHEILPPSPVPSSAVSPPPAIHKSVEVHNRPNPAEVAASASATSVRETGPSGGAAAPSPGGSTSATPTTASGHGLGMPLGARPDPAVASPADWKKRLEVLANRDFDAPVAQATAGPSGLAVAGPTVAGPAAGPTALAVRADAVGAPRADARHGSMPAPHTGGHAHSGIDPRLADQRAAGFRPPDVATVDPRYGHARPPAAGSLPADRRVMPDPRRPMPGEMARPVGRQPEFEDEEDDPPRRSIVLRVIVAVLLLGMIGAGTGYAYMNRAMLLEMLERQTAGTSDTGSAKAPLAKRAEEKPQPDAIAAKLDQQAATPAAVPPAAVPPPAAAGQQQSALAPPPATAAPAAPQLQGLMSTPLWGTITSQFPDWAATRTAEVSKLREQRVPEDTIDGRLMEAIVDLRRKNADDALSAPEDHVVSVASAFLANLKALAARSTDACYGFISRGETSPAVLPLIGRDKSVTTPVLAQLDAVMAAIAAGKKAPVSYVQPFASDYTVLSDELIKRGWSRGDLELFSNPQALSKATPEQVCRLVTGWFEAQLGIAKKEVQLRLLRQSLRPVVSG